VADSFRSTAADTSTPALADLCDRPINQTCIVLLEYAYNMAASHNMIVIAAECLICFAYHLTDVLDAELDIDLMLAVALTTHIELLARPLLMLLLCDSVSDLHCQLVIAVNLQYVSHIHLDYNRMDSALTTTRI